MIGVDDKSPQPEVHGVVAAQDPITVVLARLASDVVSTEEPDPPRYEPLEPLDAEPLPLAPLKPEEGVDDVAQADARSADATADPTAAPNAANLRYVLTMKEFLASLR